MNKLEREYNNRFKNQELPNSDFDAEDLWDSIEDNLTEENTPIGGAGYKWPFELMLGLGLTGLAVLLYFVLGQPLVQDNGLSEFTTPQALTLPPFTTDLNSIPAISNTQESAKDQTLQPEKNSASTAQENKIARSRNSNTDKITSQTKKQQKSTYLDKASLKKKNLKKDKTQESGSLLLANRAILAAKPNISNIALANEIDKVFEGETTATKVTSSSVEMGTGNIASNSMDQNNQLEVDLLPTLALMDLILEVDIIPMEKEFYKSMVVDESKTKAIWKIGGTVGVNMVHFKYRSKSNNLLADEKNKAEKVIIGATYGIKVDRPFRNGLVLGSGLEYNQLWSRFNIEKQKDYQILKEDQLVKVWVDASSGDTLNIERSDQLVNARDIRNINHYNSYQRVSVPLKVGFFKKSNKWSYGFHTGLTLNFTLSQKGKSLDTGSLPIFFDSDDKLSPYKKFDVGLFVQPIVGYYLNDSWKVNLSPQWRWNRNTDLGVLDLSVGIHQLNLSLGIQYCLGK